MKIVRARSKYGAEKEYVSNKTKIRRIIREKKASESSEQGDIQFVIKDGGVSRVWEFGPENIDSEDFNKLVELGILPIENGVGFVIFKKDGSIDFSDFEPTNEALPRKSTVDQLKRVMKMSAKTDIGNRISDMNKQGANVQYIQNPIDSGIESYEDFEKHNKKFVPSWNLKHLMSPFSGESKKKKHLNEGLFGSDLSLLEVMSAWMAYNGYKKYGFEGMLKNLGNNLKDLMANFIEYSTTIYGTPVSKEITEYEFKRLLDNFKNK